MKKRLLIICSAILAVSIATIYISTQRGRYTVYEENEQWYIDSNAGIPIKDDIKFDSDGTPHLVYSTSEYPCFSTVSQMRSVILNGELTVDNLQWLQLLVPENAPIPICNLDDLYEPTLPEGITTQAFYLAGNPNYWDSYTCALQGEGFSSGSFTAYYSMDSFLAELEKDYLDKVSIYGINKLEPKIIASEENADKTVWQIVAEMGKPYDRLSVKELCYQLDSGANILYVCEPYIVSPNNPKHRVLHIFVMHENVGFAFVLLGIQETPTIEWLSQFGVISVE